MIRAESHMRPIGSVTSATKRRVASPPCGNEVGHHTGGGAERKSQQNAVVVGHDRHLYQCPPSTWWPGDRASPARRRRVTLAAHRRGATRTSNRGPGMELNDFRCPRENICVSNGKTFRVPRGLDRATRSSSDPKTSRGRKRRCRSASRCSRSCRTGAKLSPCCSSCSRPWTCRRMAPSST